MTAFEICVLCGLYLIIGSLSKISANQEESLGYRYFSTSATSTSDIEHFDAWRTLLVVIWPISILMFLGAKSYKQKKTE